MDPGLDRVLDLAPADPVALGRLAPAAPDLVRRVDRVELTDLVVPADPHPVDRVELRRLDLLVPVELRPAELRPAELRLVGLVQLMDLVVPADPHPADPVDLDRAAREDLVARAVLTDPVLLADLDLVVPVDRVELGPVDLVGLVVPDRVAREDPVAPDLMDPVGRVAPVDHRRRLMCSMAPSIAVARNSAVLETRRTASAHPIMVLRPRPRSTGSVGTAGRLREALRRTGMDRLLPVAGMVRRLPVVGTHRGTVLAAT
jgi:hypothetical protein